MDAFCRKTEQYIKTHNLIKKGDRVLAALSGGADSVSLLCVLKSLSGVLGISLAAAHVNHGIRGESAARDEEFCRTLCERLNIPIYIARRDIPKIAAEQGISEELAGRNERYAFFEELKRKYGYNIIATAHNQNDNAETVLMHLMRGSGIKGLAGIAPRRGDVVRPLLGTTRAEIEDYCRRNAIEYVTDETNYESVYTRNKVRLSLLPLIEREFNASFIERIGANSEIIHAEDEYLDEQATAALKRAAHGGAIDAKILSNEHIAVKRRAVSIWLKSEMNTAENVPLSYVDAVLGIADKSGASVSLAQGFTAVNEFGRLSVKRGTDAPNEGFCIKLTLGEETEIPEAGIAVRLTAPDDTSAGVLYSGGTDAVYVRSRRAGDVFYPVGMTGRKKLKSYFVERKIPASLRASVPILEIDGCVANVIGHRRDRRFIGNDMKIVIRKL